MHGVWRNGLLESEFTGKRVLVTGSSRGIGAAVAGAFVELGARVIIHAHASVATAEALAQDWRASGGDVRVVVADFTVTAEVERAVDEAVAALGGLDILINNAGTMLGRHPVATISDDALSAVFDLNARSTVTACRRALPALAASGHGTIVNTSSISARSGGSTGSAAYSASKAFVSTFTRALATEVASQGIRVNAVAPGTIATDFHDRYSTPAKLAATAERIPMRRLGTAEDCVGAYLFLASHRLAGYVTGQVVEVNGGQAMP